ncbi:MAG: ATP-binding cassette domain-containing protein, partial [Syntrophaceae bacterium]|nr:ATP-binding cassette domain-containing protein [Syntrophaceae bacterium]
MSYIQAVQVGKDFGDGDAKVTAVRNIDLCIEQGSFISIMGESGSGKSTLLAMLGGLLSPSRGQIIIEGIDLYSLS